MQDVIILGTMTSFYDYFAMAAFPWAFPAVFREGRTGSREIVLRNPVPSGKFEPMT